MLQQGHLHVAILLQSLRVQDLAKLVDFNEKNVGVPKKGWKWVDIYLSIYQSNQSNLSIYQSIYQSINLSINQSIYLSTYLLKTEEHELDVMGEYNSSKTFPVVCCSEITSFLLGFTKTRQ